MPFALNTFCEIWLSKKYWNFLKENGSNVSKETDVNPSILLINSCEWEEWSCEWEEWSCEWEEWSCEWEEWSCEWEEWSCEFTSTSSLSLSNLKVSVSNRPTLINDCNPT